MPWEGVLTHPACTRVKDLELTDVAYELATSLAPEGSRSARQPAWIPDTLTNAPGRQEEEQDTDGKEPVQPVHYCIRHGGRARVPVQ